MPLTKPEVGHLGDPLELLGLDVDEPGEHRGEGDVDPDVDLAQLLLDPVGHLVDGRGVCGVDDVRRGRVAARLDVTTGAVQAASSSRANSATVAPRAPNRRAVARPMPPTRRSRRRREDSQKPCS